MVIQGNCTTTVDCEYKAHLEYTNSYTSSSKIFVICNRGDNGFVVGTNALCMGSVLGLEQTQSVHNQKYNIFLVIRSKLQKRKKGSNHVKDCWNI